MIGRCNRKCKRDLAPSDVSFASSVSVSYGYQDSAHKHAVTSAGSNTYAYDANGNMTTRVEGGLTYTQTFNAENRLASVTVNSQTTQFIYDGDGNLVKRINPDNSSAIYIGGVYEADKASNGSVVHTFVYYPAGGAMRKDGTLYFALKDQLGSVSVVTDASGNVLSRQRYQPFGQVRTDVGPTVTQTDFGYTSQRNLANLGLMDYHARMYDSYLNRWNQPDSIVPNPSNPQSLNRYSYVLNRPINLNDPSGNKPCWATHKYSCNLTSEVVAKSYNDSKDKPAAEQFFKSQGWGIALHSDSRPTIPLDPTRNLVTSSLVAANKYTITESPNPSIYGLVVVAIMLHVAITLTDIAVVAGEAALALGPEETVPELAVPLALTLAVVGAAASDFDVAFLAYTYRVATNPEVHQKIELLPPWGLNH